MAVRYDDFGDYDINELSWEDYMTDDEIAQTEFDRKFYGDSDHDLDDNLESHPALSHEQEVEMTYASREAELYVDTPACYEANTVTCPWKMTAFCDRYGVYHCMCHCDDGSPEGAWYGPVIKDWEDEVEEFEYWQREQESRGKDVWGEENDDYWSVYDYADAMAQEAEWNREMDRLVAIERENEKRARRRQATEAAENRLKKLGWRYEADDEATKWEQVSVRKTRKALHTRHFFEFSPDQTYSDRANPRQRRLAGGMTSRQAIDESINDAFDNDYESRFWWMEYSSARYRVTKVMRNQKLHKRLRGLKQYQSLLAQQDCCGTDDDRSSLRDSYFRNYRLIAKLSAKISRS